MTGEHLLWLQSYMNLSDLMQYVSINGGTSVKHPLRCVSLRWSFISKKQTSYSECFKIFTGAVKRF